MSNYVIAMLLVLDVFALGVAVAVIGRDVRKIRRWKSEQKRRAARPLGLPRPRGALRPSVRARHSYSSAPRRLPVRAPAPSDQELTPAAQVRRRVSPLG